MNLLCLKNSKDPVAASVTKIRSRRRRGKKRRRNRKRRKRRKRR
jgi:hypothetical protein